MHTYAANMDAIVDDDHKVTNTQNVKVIVNDSKVKCNF